MPLMHVLLLHFSQRAKQSDFQNWQSFENPDFNTLTLESEQINQINQQNTC